MGIVNCPNCGARNRVDESRAQTMQPVCGRCRTKLAVGAEARDGAPLTVTDASFERDVLRAQGGPVLLDCWAPWCGPCHRLAPIVDRLAAQAQGRYVVAKLNVDENPAVASRFHIGSIPTMLIFKDGRVVDELVGLQPAEAIAARLQRQL